MSAPMVSKKSVISTKKGAAVIDDVHTDVVCSNFYDKLFVVLTQYQKLGTIVLVSKDVALEANSTSTYTTTVLLGKDEPEIHVFARSLAAKINIDKPVLLSVALKDTSIRTMKAAESLVLDHKVW